MSSDEWLVISDSISIFVVLHEEHMGDVKLPGFMFTTELSRLSEDFLNLGVVSLVPIYLGLHHKHWDVLVKGGVILLQSSGDCLRISSESGVLDSLGLLSKGVNMLVSQILKFGVCFFLGRLVKNEGF